ncbi:hypothetical protein GCM10022205_58900 [Spinactinospora alkalitolerans]
MFFNQANFNGGEVESHHTKFTGGQIFLNQAKFSGSTVAFTDAVFADGRVDFAGDPDATPKPRPPASGTCPDGLAEAAPSVVRLPPEWEPASTESAEGYRR